ncbi:MAG TPA: hypothetical protein VHT27_01175 [Solirubrobacteraceae bacterium]|nr:hypothetical protein [Solirubrobacteraceae bacterium]
MAQVDGGIVPGDAEQALLSALARLKRSVGEGVSAAPDLDALRNVIGDLFEFVQLVGEGDPCPFEWPLGQVTGDSEPRYSLVPVLRGATVIDPDTLLPVTPQVALDVGTSEVPDDTPNPIGQETPVEWFGQ